MRRTSVARHVLSLFFVGVSLAASSTVGGQAQPQAQGQAQTSMGRDEIAAFAKVHSAIAQARDSIQAQLAQAGNKKEETQRQLREKLRSQIEEILHHNGMTEAEYQRKTYVVSTDSAVRRIFDSTLVKLTGVPTPGQVASGRGNVPVPAGPVGTHIGHVVNGFGDTPNGQGLLPTGLAEARIAADHAALAARDPSNLNAMKTHAGHVINAVDPTIVAAGPGLGYGVKKAAMGVAAHIDLAAKAQGASQNVITHANHIATSAKNTVQRADQVVALAKQIQAATSAADAAALVSQLVSLTAQLTAGVDSNGDGRITWQEGEGGLQQCQEHVNLMLAAEQR